MAAADIVPPPAWLRGSIKGCDAKTSCASARGDTFDMAEQHPLSVTITFGRLSSVSPSTAAFVTEWSWPHAVDRIPRDADAPVNYKPVVPMPRSSKHFTSNGQLKQLPYDLTL
eukprot:6214025-Pleurochrysis_carterae.AAC.10